jgi:hypothetical protein
VGLVHCKLTTNVSKKHEEGFGNPINYIRLGHRKLKQTPIFVLMKSVLLLIGVREKPNLGAELQ